MDDIQPINLPAEMRTIFEIKDDGCIAITQWDSHDQSQIVELTPHQTESLRQYITENIGAMRSRSVAYGGQ